MFEKDGLNALYIEQRSMLARLVAVGDHLNARFYQLDEAVEALLLAAMSGEAILLMGPPGTAKSRLIRAFCNLLGLIDDAEFRLQSAEAGAKNDRYFEYLLTQFTEPSELFGFFDLKKLHEGEGLERIQDGMMQRAEVVFLDEVFNASSAILNSLLTFMNERKFHDRGMSYKAKLKLLVGATNFPPQDRTLSAIYDRFLFRVRIENVATAQMKTGELTKLLQLGWSETHAANLARPEGCETLLEEMAQFQRDIDEKTGAGGNLRINPKDPLAVDLAALVSQMVKFELSDMSNRRMVKFAGIALCKCLLRCAREGADEAVLKSQDLDVFLRFSLDREDPSAQDKIRQILAQPGAVT